MTRPCITCITTRDHPYFKVPRHVVHPEHGKRMVWDVRGEAICPECRTRWRFTRENAVEVVADA